MTDASWRVALPCHAWGMDDSGQLWSQLRDLAARHLDPQLAARVMSLAQPAIRLIHGSADAARPAHSKLGGNPVMTRGTAWPAWNGTPLSFLALISLAQFAPLDDSGLLPPAGYLNFFYDADDQRAWGFDPAHRGGWRAIYAPPGDAAQVTAPSSVTTFPARAAGGSRTLTLPGWEEPALSDLTRKDRQRLTGLAEAWREVAGARGEWPDGEPRHQVGGWPDLIQGPVWLEAQLASHGIYVGNPAGYQDPRVPELRPGAKSWRLLLQLDTDDDLGWMWGDVGRLYYLIRQEDLAARDFSHAWMTFQCG